jgi:tRNA threonylcarbamoyladenosine biosynthesis protein TsaB
VPYILAFDITNDAGSIALADGGELMEEVAIHATDGFGHILFGEFDALLARHSLTLRDIACFGAAAGPGSFTGVRAGITAAKGLADAAGRPAVAVSNLQALAHLGTGDLRAPFVDARRGEIYGAVYDAQGNLVQAETVALYAAWAAALPAGAIPMPQRGPLARAIAAIAWQQLQAGLARDPAEIDANYVRRSDAELLLREW